MNTRRKLIAAATAIALLGATPPLMAQDTKPEAAKPAPQAQPYRPGSGYGPGPMGGLMGSPGYGHGYRMGPGIMGDPRSGMGPGMMGYGHGSGMGPGMMGGHGVGPSVMGPGMMGPGMMGGGMGRMGAVWSLDLTDEQANRLERIHDELHRQHRGLMPKMWEAQDRLRELYNAENRDPPAIGKAYAQASDLQRQMLESHVQAEKQMEEVLTREQREQLRRDYRRSERFNRYGR